MPVLFDDASSQHLSKETVKGATTVPLTFSAWFNSDDVTSQTSCLFAIADSAVLNNYFVLQLVDDKVQAEASDGTRGTATTTATFGTDEWHNALGTFTASNNRAVYLDGVNQVSNSTGVAPSSIDRTSVGRLPNSSPSQHMSGMIAHVAIWNVALSVSNIALIAVDGICPLLVDPGNLISYFPLFTPGDDADKQPPNVKLPASGGPVVGHPGPELGCGGLDFIQFKTRSINKRISTRVI